jgi:hypothetical protein
MKKFFSLTIFFVFIAFISQAFSQGDIFTVISSKEVQIKKGGAGSWAGLAVGSKLNGTDVIKANSGGIANLLHISNGKVVKFNQTNDTKVADLEKNVKSSGQDQGLAGQLLNAAANNKLNPTSKVSANIGGVRATESVTKEVFLITPRRGTKVLNTLPVFIWNHMQNETEYQLIILTEDLTPIKTTIVKDTIYNYSKNDPALEKGNAYVCIVKPMRAQKPSEYQTFTIVADSECAEIKKRLDLTESLLTDADELGKCILRGTTNEDLGLYTEAYLNYMTAIKLAPKEKAYKKMLADLLVKTNLIKQASYLSGYDPTDSEQK